MGDQPIQLKYNDEGSLIGDQLENSNCTKHLTK